MTVGKLDTPVIIPSVLLDGSIPAVDSTAKPLVVGAAIRSKSLTANLKVKFDAVVGKTLNAGLTVIVFVEPLYETTLRESPAEGPESIVTVEP